MDVVIANHAPAPSLAVGYGAGCQGTTSSPAKGKVFSLDIPFYRTRRETRGTRLPRYVVDLERVAPHGARYPAAGVAVTVYNQYAGKSSPGHAGQDGLYYLYNVPAGYYTLEVWVSPDPRVPPTVYQIQV